MEQELESKHNYMQSEDLILPFYPKSLGFLWSPRKHNT